MIPYKFHKGDNYWDNALIKDVLKDPRFTDEEGEGCIYMVPGEYADVKEVNEALKKYQWVVLIVTSDEQSKFKVEKINHSKIKIYVQYPKQARHDEYGKWPLGYTSETRQNLKLLKKDLDYYFSGQVTHNRRQECYEQLQTMQGGQAHATDGFAKGIPPKEYIGLMCRAKTAPAPAGPVCADSFRVYEALEAGAIPIADNTSLAGDHDYFNYLFGNPPFPTLNYYHDLPGYIEDQLKEYPQKNNRIQAWWIKYKRDLKQQLLDDVAELSGKAHKAITTVVVPVSPIKSHPSTEKLDLCINSIRHHFKDTEIIITFDGVRKEQESKRNDYEEFIRRALFKCNTEWNATPLIFDNHTHQVSMMRKALEIIDTPTVAYVEGDTGFVTDREIDWQYCYKKLLDGTSSLIRFHFEAFVPKEHEHMMLDYGEKLIKTAQWSQRPHLASTAYYRRILDNYFSANANSFIEDKMHSVVHEAYRLDGVTGWLQHRLHIYAPEENIKYSVDFDGREGEQKYDAKQTF